MPQQEEQKKYVVGIDLGTSSCKTAIFDREGKMYACAKKPYPSYCPKAGIVEQREEEILEAVFGSCRQAIEGSGIARESIAAVSFSVNAGGSMFVDEDNRTIRNVIGWQDARAKECLERLIKMFPTFYTISNVPFMPYIGIVGRYQWMYKFEPETMARAKKICTFVDWLGVEFGAEDYYIDTPSACTMGLVNGTTRKYAESLLKFANVDEARLPIISNEAGRVVGTVSAAAAGRSGLPEGCKIALGAHDMDCSCLGAGAVEDGDCVMIVGTIGALSYVSAKPVHTVAQDVLSMPKQGQNKWLLRSLNTTSASALQWFSDALCNASDGITDPAEPVSFEKISEAAAKSPIGCGGVCFNPNMIDGMGGFYGLSNATTKGDMARAVMESIAFNIRKSMKIEDKIGFRAEAIKLSGGASNSAFWCQMFADVLGRTIITNYCPEVGCLGAAIFGAVGAGMYATLEQAAEGMVSERNRFAPDKDNIKAYDAAYAAWLKETNNKSSILKK